MPRGFHPITRYVIECLPEMSQIEIGLLHVFIRHTSASLTINENADPDVLTDLESSISAIAPVVRRWSERGPGAGAVGPRGCYWTLFDHLKNPIAEFAIREKVDATQGLHQ